MTATKLPHKTEQDKTLYILCYAIDTTTQAVDALTAAMVLALKSGAYTVDGAKERWSTPIAERLTKLEAAIAKIPIPEARR